MLSLAIYGIISWADVLAHQMTGSVSAWNLFNLIVKIGGTLYEI